MAKRKRVGLYFESYSTLPAYVIYTQNIIRTINLAVDSEKPELVILHLTDSPINEIKEINYPYIEFYCLPKIKNSLTGRAINKISRKILKKNLLSFIDSGFPKNLDCIFPYNFRPECDYIKHKILWKPDFQEFHLPSLFTSAELNYNKQFLDAMAVKPFHLVLSSEDAARDYNKAYPNHLNKIHLWKFTSFLPDTTKINVKVLRAKFNINSDYFLVANQFWPHKNHINVLKALKICMALNCDFQIVFTGKQKSSRDIELFDKLKHYIEQNNLQKNIIFTGFIPRDEQITLMSQAKAVIQPSLFEGWSTVIEDCKALNQFVIASDLSVNREQISENVVFFNPYNYKDLAEKLVNFLKEPPEKIQGNYTYEITKFKNNILTTFYSI